jgi:hypothetical protein
MVGGARYGDRQGTKCLLAVTTWRLIAIACGRDGGWDYAPRNEGVEVWELRHLLHVQIGGFAGESGRVSGPTMTLHNVEGAGPRQRQTFFIPLEAPEFSQQGQFSSLAPWLSGQVDAGVFAGSTTEEQHAHAKLRAKVAAELREKGKRSKLVDAGCLAVLMVVVALALSVVGYVFAYDPSTHLYNRYEDAFPFWLCSGFCCMAGPLIFGGTYFWIRRKRAAL